MQQYQVNNILHRIENLNIPITEKFNKVFELCQNPKAYDFIKNNFQVINARFVAGKTYYDLSTAVSINPNIEIDFFTQNNIDINWHSISSTIDFEYVLNNKDKPWNWGRFGLSSNKNITEGFILETLTPNDEWASLPNWDFEELSTNPEISENVVERTSDRNWNWDLLVYNPAISNDFIRDNINVIKYPDGVPKFNMIIILSTERASADVISANINMRNAAIAASRNPNLTPEIVSANMTKNWKWTGDNSLSKNVNYVRRLLDIKFGRNRNPNINHESLFNDSVRSKSEYRKSRFAKRYEKKLKKNLIPIIETQYSNLSWGSDGLSTTNIATFNFVQNNPTREWNFGENGLSNNPTWVQGLMEKFNDGENINNILQVVHWGKGGLSSNPSVTANFIRHSINQNWDFRELSFNPNLTMDLVINNFNQNWDLSAIFNDHNQHIHLNPTPDFIREIRTGYRKTNHPNYRNELAKLIVDFQKMEGGDYEESDYDPYINYENFIPRNKIQDINSVFHNDEDEDDDDEDMEDEDDKDMEDDDDEDMEDGEYVQEGRL